MNKKLLLSLLMCSAPALHTAKHRDLVDFKAALVQWQANKSQANLDKLLDIYETLTADTLRTEWAQQARTYAQQRNVDIDQLAAMPEEEAPVRAEPVVQPEPIPSVVVAPVAPAPVAPVSQPALVRAATPPPAPAPVQRRPSLQPAAEPVMQPVPSAPAQEPVVAMPWEQAPEEELFEEEQAEIAAPTPSASEEEMEMKYEAEKPQPFVAEFPEEEDEEVAAPTAAPIAPAPVMAAQEPSSSTSVSPEAAEKRLHTLLENLDDIYNLIERERRKDIEPNIQNRENFLKQFSEAQQIEVAPKNKKDKARHEKLNKEYAELYQQLVSGQPLAIPAAPARPWFPFGKKQAASMSPEEQADNAQFTTLAQQVHDVRENLAKWKDKPELPTMVQQQSQMFVRMKPKFRSDEPRTLQISRDIRYINDYLNNDKAVADQNEVELKEFDKTLAELNDLAQKFSELDRTNKSRKASDEKRFVELYNKAEAAYEKGMSPSYDAVKWDDLMHQGSFFTTYRLLSGKTQPIVASGSSWFGE